LQLREKEQRASRLCGQRARGYCGAPTRTGGARFKP
jgi:hypothetical protein